MQGNEMHPIVAQGQQLFAEFLKIPNQKVQVFKEEILKKFEEWKEEALEFMPKGINRKIQRELSRLFKKFENLFYKTSANIVNKEAKSIKPERVCKFTLSKLLSDAYIDSLPEEEVSEEELCAIVLSK